MAPKHKPEKHLRFYDHERQTHMGLFQSCADDHIYEVSSTPLFTGPIRKYCLGAGKGKPSEEQILPQFGLLACDASQAPRYHEDPRVFFNVGTPHSVFICGSQGSGKSHTLATLLENCLLKSNANMLTRPLTGLVLHYDRLISDAAGSPCESAYLSSDPSVRVRVLCPPTSIVNLRRIYSKLPNVTVEELRLGQADLNTKRMMDLMAVKPGQNGQMPLYLHVVNRILRDLRLQQQHSGGGFDYQAFKKAIDAERLTETQYIPLQQRLETLESFMARQNPPMQSTTTKKKKKKGKDPTSYKEQNRTTWAPTPSRNRSYRSFGFNVTSALGLSFPLKSQQSLPDCWTYVLLLSYIDSHLLNGSPF
ncbi:hypothetical protein FSARC_12629 [Fusarium sarcochroum]|uniref:Uncharacterized protein n=1 Tax=Fusarium sarcochroum TaxID=1208366 RepID=A0A8H4T6Z7_9HYPO|nr:hypothetical protein FSARC_12629 [Fusarium sarcochroum]